jgi:hypothetical protein
MQQYGKYMQQEHVDVKKALYKKDTIEIEKYLLTHDINEQSEGLGARFSSDMNWSPPQFCSWQWTYESYCIQNPIDEYWMQNCYEHLANHQEGIDIVFNQSSP